MSGKIIDPAPATRHSRVREEDASTKIKELEKSLMNINISIDAVMKHIRILHGQNQNQSVKVNCLLLCMTMMEMGLKLHINNMKCMIDISTTELDDMYNKTNENIDLLFEVLKDMIKSLSTADD